MDCRLTTSSSLFALSHSACCSAGSVTCALALKESLAFLCVYLGPQGEQVEATTDVENSCYADGRDWRLTL